MYCLEVYIFFFFFFKQKTAYEMLRSLVGSEMCIRDSSLTLEPEYKGTNFVASGFLRRQAQLLPPGQQHDDKYLKIWQYCICLLYTSDAADEEDSVDLGGRRIIKKKKKKEGRWKCGDRKENNRSIRMRLRRQYSCVTE
eukprot:TRINITY_DN1175_c0_g1_i11.p2 TRINITY_DN1175_c0_g1~~TRINITY_DN1175_c0_g1_i11.p2  ORF type:complete len:139 (+),score=44.91 TRINITY_DN1175_c0_g1_i11:33-449(+)